MENQMTLSDTASQSLGNISANVAVKVAGRLLFVDNIRIFLTILVLLHHLMITYAGSGAWVYIEGRQDTITTIVGAWFCVVNQAFFMSLFLLISAYFVPGAFDRKGAGRFLKDRLIRLGIPLAVYSWVIDPLFVYARLVISGSPHPPLWEFFPGQYFGNYGPLIGAGPLWFIETLLIFSFVYVLWRLLAPTRSAQPIPPAAQAQFPGKLAIALFALLVGVASFLIRLQFPEGWNFETLNLQFPFFAEYIALFVVGLIAYRRNWLLGLPEATGRLGLRIAVILSLSHPLIVVTTGALKDATPFMGGWHWQALVYALWRSCLCVSMCIGLVYFFRRYLDRQSKLADVLSHNAYTAYIIHAPIITVIAYSIRDVALYPLLKWGLAAMVAIPLCFALSGLIRKLPYADRIL